MNTEKEGKNKPFYITTTLPYVNSKPHVGFAMEVIRADAIARYKRLLGFDVFFNTGTDEHGVKIQEKAQELGKTPKEYTDEMVKDFQNLKDSLNLSFDKFIRTTDEEHQKAAQEFWKRCDEKGDIYKKEYKVKYCIGCELEKTDSELDENGRCPDHPNRDLEEREEENYFFKLSNYEDQLLDLYKNNPQLVTPDYRLNEVKEFVKGGLKDFSISRLKEKMSWGIPVPGDDDHVMYVWFDALVNYISTLGWPDDTDNFEKYWTNGTPVQYAGKDNLRQQSLMWQSMLLSAGLPNTNRIIINGFILSDGQKMSKSLGNVIDPVAVADEYGVDALRYFVLGELSPFEDSDFTMDKFKEAYNANLANGIGNLTNRIMKMSETNIGEPVPVLKSVFDKEYMAAFEEYNLQKVSDFVWKLISDLDQKIQETEPFKLVKEDKEKGEALIKELVQRLYDISNYLLPLLPDTAQNIQKAIAENKKPEGLFERKD